MGTCELNPVCVILCKYKYVNLNQSLNCDAHSQFGSENVLNCVTTKESTQDTVEMLFNYNAALNLATQLEIYQALT